MCARCTGGRGCSGRCKVLLKASDLWRGGMSAFEDGDADAGEAMQREALSLVRSLGGFAVLEARILNNLGVILSCAGRHVEAAREFARALTLLTGRVDPQTRFHQVIAGNYKKTFAAGLAA